MHSIQREFDELYQNAIDVAKAAFWKGYFRGLFEGIAVGLVLALLVWALSR